MALGLQVCYLLQQNIAAATASCTLSSMLLGKQRNCGSHDVRFASTLFSAATVVICGLQMERERNAGATS